MEIFLLGKKYIRQVVTLLFFAFLTIIYFHNLTKDIYSGDTGDLVTAGYVLGVAHPSGYPLFSFLGFIFSHLPLSLQVVTKVALINAIASLIGLFIFFRFSITITKSYLLSFIATSILAFSYLFWFHAEIPEVFGLNNLFVIIILSLGIYFHKKETEKTLFAFTFFCGLALTHHQTILFLFPPIALLILMHYKFILARKKRFFFMFLFFFLGLLPYIYVPFAAARNPVINWDNATTLPHFINLVLRRDYGGFAPGVVDQIPLAVKLIHIHAYFNSLITTFSYQTTFLVIIGVIYLLRKEKRLAAFLLFAFIFSGPFYAYYGANLATTSASFGIIERFYAMSFIVFMYFIPYSLFYLNSLLKKQFSKPYYSLLLLSYFFIVPFFMFQINYPKTNLSTTQIGNTFARNIFASVPKDAVLFVSGDTTTFSVWYNYYVLGLRPDIHLINPAGVGGNNYLDEEINTYKKQHPDTKLSTIVGKTVADLSTKKRLFATFEIDTIPLPKDTVLLPRGLVYEFVKRTSLPMERQFLNDFEKQWKQIKIVRNETLQPNEQNLVTAEIPMFYANGLTRIGDFLLEEYKDPKTAEHYYRRALWIDDENVSAYAGLSLSLYKGYKDCSMAIDNMKTAIDLYPIWEKYYTQLYIMYDGCSVDEKSKQDLAQKYQTYFHKSLPNLVNQLEKTRIST